MEQFYEYNPAVEDDCSGLWPDMAYCIRGPGYTPPPSSTTSSAPPTSSTTTPATPTPPAPTHPGQPEDCDEWCVFPSFFSLSKVTNIVPLGTSSKAATRAAAWQANTA